MRWYDVLIVECCVSFMSDVTAPISRLKVHLFIILQHKVVQQNASCSLHATHKQNKINLFIFMCLPESSTFDSLVHRTLFQKASGLSVFFSGKCERSLYAPLG